MSNSLKPPQLNEKSGDVSLGKMPSLGEGEIDYPVFCFRHLHKDYDFKRCSRAENKLLKACVQKIQSVSCLSWHDIQLTDRHGNGTEKISRSSLKVAIPTSTTKEVKELLAFHFSGTQGQIIGYRNGYLFHVFFIDTKQEVYSH